MDDLIVWLFIIGFLAALSPVLVFFHYVVQRTLTLPEKNPYPLTIKKYLSDLRDFWSNKEGTTNEVKDICGDIWSFTRPLLKLILWISVAAFFVLVTYLLFIGVVNIFESMTVKGLLVIIIILLLLNSGK